MTRTDRRCAELELRVCALEQVLDRVCAMHRELLLSMADEETMLTGTTARVDRLERALHDLSTVLRGERTPDWVHEASGVHRRN